MNHQILSPYTAFVGVETTGPKINNTHSKVRHIPIQISKGDEHLTFNQPAFYSSYRGVVGHRGRPKALPPMPWHGPPMAMASMYGQMPPTQNMPQYRLRP
jgi:hypothetical protein